MMLHNLPQTDAVAAGRNAFAAAWAIYREKAEPDFPDMVRWRFVWAAFMQGWRAAEQQQAASRKGAA